MIRPNRLAAALLAISSTAAIVQMLLGCGDDAPPAPGEDWIRIQPGADTFLLDAPARVTSASVVGDSLFVSFTDVNCRDSLLLVSPDRFEAGTPPRLPVYISWKLRNGVCSLDIIPRTLKFYAYPAKNLYWARYHDIESFDLLLITRGYTSQPESTLVRYPN